MTSIPSLTVEGKLLDAITTASPSWDILKLKSRDSLVDLAIFADRVSVSM